MKRLGLIGGSAVYEMEGLEIIEKKAVKTPFGAPSGNIVIGKMAGKEVVFLPRHGQGHIYLPSEINYRANIYALKLLEVDTIISISAVGSLKKEVKPLDILLPDQFIDRTNRGRCMTFFGDGIVAHIAFGDPICERVRNIIYDSNKDLGVQIHNGGTYINMEGPAFSTKAESNLYRSWDADIIGMTNLAEAKLAREAGICYSTIAMITDYDCWHDEEQSVTIEMILENLRKNAETAKKMASNTIKNFEFDHGCSCHQALKYAIVTQKDNVPQDTLEKLGPIIEGFI